MTPVSSELTGGTATVSEASRGALAPELIVTATNVGGAASDGSTIALSDVLPSWLTATRVVGYDAYGAALAAKVKAPRRWNAHKRRSVVHIPSRWILAIS